MRLRNLAALAAVALLVALPAVAQEQRGAIEGVIKDAQGGAVVGATVTAKSAAGLAVESVTDATGTYRFAALAPGRYELTTTLAGFAPAKVQNIDLRLGQQLNINMALTPGGVTETVQVVGESPLIAITQSARATSIRDEEIDKLPKGRDFTSLVAQVPGANQEAKLGGISIDGSSGGENRYIIDGAESTDLQTGVSGKTLVTDFVDEVQVKSSGYTAEYGGSTGGVINVLTKSGSNAWRGDALLYYSGDSLDADRRPTLRLSPLNDRVSEYVTYAEDDYTRWEPGFNLSGPIVKDKLWFFAGYLPQFRPLDRTVRFLSNNQTATYRNDFKSHYITANVTAQLGPQWRFRTAYNSSHQRSDGALPPLDGTGSPTANYGVNEVFPNWAGSATLDYTPSNKVFMSLRAGYYNDDYYIDKGIYQGDRFTYSGSSLGLAGVPSQWQFASGYANVPAAAFFGVDKDNQKRFQLQFDTTLFFDAGGQHQMKVGAQLDRLGLDQLEGETGNRLIILWNQALSGQRGTFGYYRVRSNGVLPQRGFLSQGNVTVNNLGLFIQDSWTIGQRLTLNLGLRTENEHVPSFSQDPAIPEFGIEWGFGKKVAPRVGFAWDATGDGKTKVYGSWGIFYDIFKLELPLGSFGGQKWLEYYYALDSGDLSGIVDNQNCPPACPGRLLRGPIDFRHPSNDPREPGGIDPELDPMKMQEFVAGVEREIAPNLSVSARYVRKWLNRAIEDAGALDAQGNEIYTIANPGFGVVSIAHILPNGTKVPYPEAQRDYDGVELALNKRLSNNWSARVSYLWSELFGNYSGLSQSDENGRTSPNVGRIFDYPAMAFGQDGKAVFGQLATDRTHQFKAYFLYDFNFGLTTGLGWFGASGVPKSREMGIFPPNNLPVQYLGRGSDGRMPFSNQVDLYAQYRMKLGDRSALTFSANVTNLIDSDTATNYFQTEHYNSGINIDENLFYAGQLNFQTLKQQQGVLTDARFLQDSAYQAPRSIRLGVKFSF